MDDFIGSAPPTQLLILIACPLTMALLFAGFIVFSLSQRSKKSQMKLGIAPKQSPSAQIPENPAQIQLPATPLPEASPPPPSTEELSRLDFLSKPVVVEKKDSPMAEIPQPSPSEPINLAARLGSSPESQAPVPPQAVSEPIELLRLLRHPASGQLIVEVAGQRYTKLAEISDKKIGQYILKLVAHLLVFTNGVILTGAGMKSLAVPKVEEVPEPLLAPQERLRPQAPPPLPVSPPPPAVPAAPSPEVEAALLASLKAAAPTPPPPPKRGFFGRATSQPAPHIPGLNLAGEINEIVQARLRYSPLAQNRIEITADPRGGIRIQVNNNFYGSPDEIEEGEVKDLIKASIQEWERK
jgi:hypothetical protein